MLYDRIHELARALRASSEYAAWQKAQKELAKNKESQKILHDFQAKQMEMQTMQMLEKEIPEAKKEEFKKMLDLLQFHPTVQEYLEAEFRLGQILEDIQKIITDVLDLKPELAD